MSEGRKGSLTRGDILLVLAIALGVLLIWQLSQILLLLFAAIILAVLLNAASGFVRRYTPLNTGFALLFVILIAGAALGGLGYLFGTRVQAELADLLGRLPDLAEAAGRRLNIPNPIPKVRDYLSDLAVSDGMLGNLAGYTTNLVGILGSILLVLVGGIYLAVDPQLYRHGLVLLIPAHLQDKANTALVASGEALKRWLLGQLIAMVVVGVAIGVGLQLLGVESALSLGVVAGILEFVPFFGPVLSAVPAVLIALSSGDQTVFWVIGLYLLVQQVENNFLVPIIQRRTTDLPPVLGIFAVIALGVMFGPLGVLFGTPLTVVAIVLVKYLYVRGTLHEDVSIIGVDQQQDGSSTADDSDRNGRS